MTKNQKELIPEEKRNKVAESFTAYIDKSAKSYAAVLFALLIYFVKNYPSLYEGKTSLAFDLVWVPSLLSFGIAPLLLLGFISTLDDYKGMFPSFVRVFLFVISVLPGLIAIILILGTVSNVVSIAFIVSVLICFLIMTYYLFLSQKVVASSEGKESMGSGSLK